MNEFDEQSATKEEALNLVYLKWKECLHGNESRGVVDAYEDAARRKGATGEELALAYERAKELSDDEIQQKAMAVVLKAIFSPGAP